VDILVTQFLRDGFGRDHALVAGLVRKPRAGGDIADRPDALDIGAARTIGLDMARSALTPSASSPMFSTLPTMPTATMTWLNIG
jgi:hypothetical protein